RGSCVGGRRGGSWRGPALPPRCPRGRPPRVPQRPARGHPPAHLRQREAARGVQRGVHPHLLLVLVRCHRRFGGDDQERRDHRRRHRPRIPRTTSSLIDVVISVYGQHIP